MALIQDILDNISPYAATYKHLRQVELEEHLQAAAENRPLPIVRMKMFESPDQRRYNAPLHEEVAAVFSMDDAEFKLRNADDIDRLICAQLPDPEPVLYEIIKANMIHGPCGVLNNTCPCMKDGSCSKGYPKSFNDATVMNVDGFPLYHRPDNGRTVRVRNVDLDSRWVVPYSPYLFKKYNAHINLEACVSIKAGQYLYKYIYKGHDKAHIEISERLDHDIIKTFLVARYVSAPEGCWRLIKFDMHTQSHNVVRLAVHLPNFQRVHFRPGEEGNAVQRAEQKETKLTAWFLLNRNDPTSRQILYTNIPHDYVFNNNRWKARERGTVISRMYNASIREGERRTFCTILIHGEPNNPVDLWENYKEFMVQDFLRQHVELQAEHVALAHIEAMLKQFGKSLDDFNLPHLDFELVAQQPDAEANRQEAAEIRLLLNNDQTIVADAVLEALSNNDHNSAKLFFLDEPAGTGKTFTITL
ncbi:uncharacterized protein [Clytia hemisphaerica]|uniref:uncharacterized protein n=1 Tax=Clytia hemisphaerica TaxID=252671 RepID=UPI0034D4500D